MIKIVEACIIVAVILGIINLIFDQGKGFQLGLLLKYGLSPEEAISLLREDKRIKQRIILYYAELVSKRKD